MQSHLPQPESLSGQTETQIHSLVSRPGALSAQKSQGDRSAFGWRANSSEPELSSISQFAQLLKIREDERQRIGQELHDSTGQLVIALQLSVAHLRALHQDCGHDDLVDDIEETTRQIDREIRSLAFLQYPAELGDCGLIPAVSSLCRDFGNRTGICTTFKSVGDAGDETESISMTVLRVVQEALVNIHRHAHASSAKVVIETRGDRIHLSVADDGVGMDEDLADMPQGIGLQGMRHRVEMLGGRFRIKNMRQGVKVSASLPLTVR